MGFTKVIGAGIKTTTDARVGILTAERFDGPFTDLTVTNNLTVGGVLTYEDVKNVDAIGIITARKDIHVGAGISVVGIVTAATGNFTTANITNLTGTLSGVSTNFVSAVGIQSAGTIIGAGITQLNFVGVGNTFVINYGHTILSPFWDLLDHNIVTINR